MARAIRSSSASSALRAQTGSEAFTGYLLWLFLLGQAAKKNVFFRLLTVSACRWPPWMDDVTPNPDCPGCQMLLKKVAALEARLARLKARVRQDSSPELDTQTIDLPASYRSDPAAHVRPAQNRNSVHPEAGAKSVSWHLEARKRHVDLRQTRRHRTNEQHGRMGAAAGGDLAQDQPRYAECARQPFRGTNPELCRHTWPKRTEHPRVSHERYRSSRSRQANPGFRSLTLSHTSHRYPGIKPVNAYPVDSSPVSSTLACAGVLEMLMPPATCTLAFTSSTIVIERPSTANVW